MFERLPLAKVPVRKMIRWAFRKLPEKFHAFEKSGSSALHSNQSITGRPTARRGPHRMSTVPPSERVAVGIPASKPTTTACSSCHRACLFSSKHPKVGGLPTCSSFLVHCGCASKHYHYVKDYSGRAAKVGKRSAHAAAFATI